MSQVRVLPRSPHEEREVYGRDFCYWLQGYFEIAGTGPMTEEQVKVVQNHLNLVFVHEIDPAMGDAKHQEKLNAVHKPPIPAASLLDDMKLPGKVPVEANPSPPWLVDHWPSDPKMRC
jgi:hypothetical protein